MNSTQDTRRLARNTLLLYARMLFSLLVSLYSSRVILAALGEVDYGLYNVVGGVVAMFSLVTTAMSSAMSRFLTFELGRGDTVKLKRTFAISLELEMLLSVVVVILVEAIAVWFLNTRMSIPAERMTAANWILQFSLVSFVLSLLLVPFDASIISHERMDFYAYVSIFDVLFKLGIALFLAYSHSEFDRLIMYGLLLVVGKFLVQFVYRWFCRKHFEECHFSFCKDKDIVREMLGFASWNFFGSAATLLSNQGISIVLNIFIGPAINAARGLAQTVSTILSNFVNNFTMALRPQITKAYAEDDLPYTRMLVSRGGRFSYYIFLILALPVILEADFLLDLWLVDVPDHTVNFVRLILLLCTTDILSMILGMAQLATGKVKYFQIAISSLTSLNFILSYIFLKLKFEPEVIYVIAISVSLICLFVRLEFAKRSIGLSIREYAKDVYLNIALVSVVSMPLPIACHFLLPSGWLRLLVVGAASVSVSVLAVLFVGCSRSERRFVVESAGKFLRKRKETL